jgi:hypothetical protein
VGIARRGNKIYQYYCGTHLTHGGTRGMRGEEQAKQTKWGWMGLAEQRLDGFYSADADYEGGRLRTPPIVFAGTRLEININTSAVGQARVAILDAEGKPIPGFSIQDCDPIATNDVAHRVTWKGNADVSGLAGKPVRLAFAMRAAKLYAFQFVE